MGAFRFAVAGTALALALACQPALAQDASSQQSAAAPMKLDSFMSKKKSVRSTKPVRQAKAKTSENRSRKAVARKSVQPTAETETSVAAQLKPGIPPFSQFKDNNDIGADVSAFAPTDSDRQARIKQVKVKPAAVPMVSPHELNEIDLAAANPPKSDAAIQPTPVQVAAAPASAPQAVANREWLLPLIAALGGTAILASAGLIVFRRG